MKAVFPTVVAAGLVFAGGWMLGRHAGTMERVEETEARSAARAGRSVESVPHETPPAWREPDHAESLLPVEVLWQATLEDRHRVENWMGTASAAELEAVIAALGDPPEPSWMSLAALRLWAARDPQAALRRFEEWPALTRFALLGALVAGWAHTDAAGAVSWLATQPANAAIDGARASTLTRLAATEPETALAILRANGWLRDSPQAMRRVFQMWLPREPAVTLDHWRRLNLELNPPLSPEAAPPVPPFTEELLASALLEVATTKGPEATIGMIEALTDREANEIGAWRWVISAVKQHPERLLPALEVKLDPEKMADLVKALARQKPDQAAAMAAVLATPELRALCEPPPPPQQADTFPAATPGTDPADRISWDEPIILTP